MESSLGITHFFNDKRDETDLIIKDTPNDFIVQEITPTGEVCRKSSIININAYIKSVKLLIYIFKKSKVESEISEYINSLDTEKCLEKVNIENIKQDYVDLSFCPIDIKCKELRTRIHRMLKYNLHICTKTINEQIIVKRSDSNVYNFVLQKVMLNTVDACKMVSKHLGSSVAFAGNKDKVAVTFQEVSCKVNINTLIEYAYRYTECTQDDYDNLKMYKFLENLPISDEEYQMIEDYVEAADEEYLNVKKHKVNEELDSSKQYIGSSINIYNIKRGKQKKLGDLSGNKFTITIKNKTNLNYKNIENGFINYYGLQRFGKAKNNHIVGMRILNKQYEEAVKLIVANSKGYEDFTKNNFEDCLKKCDNLERFFFKNLIENKDVDYAKLIFRMPRTIRMLYLHSYQSFIFNQDVNDALQATNINEDCMIELKKMQDKMLKGGTRQAIAKGKNVVGYNKGNDFVVSFDLPPSCYATMALREL